MIFLVQFTILCLIELAKSTNDVSCCVSCFSVLNSLRLGNKPQKLHVREISVRLLSGEEVLRESVGSRTSVQNILDKIDSKPHTIPKLVCEGKIVNITLTSVIFCCWDVTQWNCGNHSRRRSYIGFWSKQEVPWRLCASCFSDGFQTFQHGTSRKWHSARRIER